MDSITAPGLIPTRKVPLYPKFSEHPKDKPTDVPTNAKSIRDVSVPGCWPPYTTHDDRKATNKPQMIRKQTRVVKRNAKPFSTQRGATGEPSCGSESSAGPTGATSAAKSGDVPEKNAEDPVPTYQPPHKRMSHQNQPVEAEVVGTRQTPAEDSD